MNRSETDPGPTQRVAVVSPVNCVEDPLDSQEIVFDPKIDIIPEYEIFNQIGAGGCGKVYRARQIKLDRFVALKIIALDPATESKSSKPFESEAHLLAKLNHPNVVRIYDFGRTEKFMYLAMELLEGEDFATRLQFEGKLGEWETWWIIRQAAAGLAHAASVGIVHRDIKPANLFFTSAPEGSRLPDQIPNVIVMDFGLALVKWNARDGLKHSRHAVVLGTPAYMAPEQHQTMDVDLRADIFALGATAYHALTGRLPFHGGTIWDVAARKLDRTPRSLPYGLEKSARLITAMMEPRIDRRIQSYDELIGRIDQLLSLPEKKVKSESASAFQFAKRNMLLMGAFVALFLMGYVAARRIATNRPTIVPFAKYHTNGVQESFFDGVSLNRWASSGFNAVEKDEEGTSVLSVSGLIQHALPDAEDYRITLGVDLFQAKATEIQMVNTNGGNDSQRLAIRITKEDGAVFGIKSELKGGFRPIGRAIAYPSENWLRDRRPYLEIRLERTGSVWSAWFHGELLGLHVLENRHKNQILIVGENGRTHLDTVLWERLEPDEP